MLWRNNAASISEATVSSLRVLLSTLTWGFLWYSPLCSGEWCECISKYTAKFSLRILEYSSTIIRSRTSVVGCVWNVMEHVQKPDFVFRRNERVHLNRPGRQFSRLLASDVCASAVVMVVMLDTPCSEVACRVLVTHSIRQFPLHFPSRASPCAITFQLDSTDRFRGRVSSVIKMSGKGLEGWGYSFSRYGNQFRVYYFTGIWTPPLTGTRGVLLKRLLKNLMSYIVDLLDEGIMN